MRDLPEAPALLALARDVLLNDLLPLLPPERRLEALLVANCMAIAEREAVGAEAAETIVHELERLYVSEGPSPSRFAGPSLSRSAGEGAERSDAGEGKGGDGAVAELLRRFACELRIGAFEKSPDREARARAILWALTIARLRLANPRFLAANGLA
jgi:hypothetical protein